MEHLIFESYDKDYKYICIDKGITAITSREFTPLMYLVINTNEYPELNQLIGNFKDSINDKNEIGFTALMLAAVNCHDRSSIETVKVLLEHGADVNLVDNEGWSALMMAVRYSNTDSSIETVRLLIENGADVNLVDNQCWSALMLAARNSNSDSSIETVRLLLDHSADPNLIDNQCWSALMLAARNSNSDSSIETVKLLLDYETNPDLQNDNGYTALMLAIKYCNKESSLETVKVLLERGANRNYKAISLACQYNHLDAVKLLLDYGAHVTPKCYYNDSINKLILSYQDIVTLKNNIKDSKHIQLYVDEIFEKIKIEKIKSRNYERVLRRIQNHDAAVRFKIGNMGYKINKYDFDKICTPELLDYLSATEDTLQEKVTQYLYAT